MTFKQFLGILRARFLMIASILITVVIVISAVSLMLTPRYTATAQLLIDVKTPDPVAGQVLPAHLLNSYIATQVELMTSEKVALRVVDSLGLDKKPEWQARLADSPAAKLSDDSRKLAIATLLLKDLKVRPSKDSNLLVVSYVSPDRETVADVANAFMKEYIDTTVDLRIQPARQTKQFFSEQAKQAREELQRAQEKLSEFRRSKGLATTDEKDDVENMRLQELSQQLTILQAGRVEASRKRESAASSRNGAKDVPEVLASALIQNLKGQLAAAEARLSERSTVLGPNHPEILRMQEEVQSLSRRIASETANITGSLERNYQISAAREGEIRAALERQQAIVLANKGHREQIAMLQKDVDAAQRAYDAVFNRASQTSLESQVTQANIAPIASAVMPLRPSSPNTPLNLAVGVVFGLLLGVVSALLAESLNGKIRQASDLERITGAAVVGELGAAPRRLLDKRESGSSPLLGDGGRAEPLLVGKSDTAAAPAPVTLAPLTDPEEAVPGALMDAGLLPRSEVEAIAAMAEEKGIRFGEAALASGKVTQEQMDLALSVRTNFPLLDPSNTNVQHEVVAAFDVNHPFMDDLRMLRTRIKARLDETGDVGGRVVAVVSDGSNEGKSFSAANLAVSFAQMGDRTLLIDADMRGGRQHHLFSLKNETGLSSVLSMRCNPKEALQQVPGMGELIVMTAGPDVPSPTDLLARNSTRQLMQLMSHAFDVVIVDTPAAGAKPDASLIVAAAKNYVIVARQNHTLTAAIDKLTRNLGRLGARMIGSVLVKA